MAAPPTLAAAEEAELDRRLADVHRYPLQLNAYHWSRLRELARSGNRRGQLELLRRAVPGDAVAPGASPDGRPGGMLVELLDRVHQLEMRLAAAERRIDEMDSTTRAAEKLE